jgi:hypothetical protein
MKFILAGITIRTSPEDMGAFFTFAIFWIILGISSFAFFHFNRNAALKRRVFPILVVAAGLIFGCFVAYMCRRNLEVMFMVVPAIALITFLNFRTTRFCDACGRTVYRRSIFSRSQFCPQCGAQLK